VLAGHTAIPSHRGGNCRCNRFPNANLDRHNFLEFSLDLSGVPVTLAANNGLFSVPAPLFDRSPEDQWGFFH
jgi:hypothetical protein